MALLTAEDVLNKAFSKTKYREGFDQDEVDDFLDEVANSISALTAERDELQARLAQYQAGGVTPVAPAPAVDRPGGVSSSSADLLAAATDPNPPSATTMLSMAQKLHDDYVQAGEAERDRIIDEGKSKAEAIVEQAETDARLRMQSLDAERADLERRIDDLRRFERDYRGHLRNYLENLLGDLEHNSSRGGVGAPVGDAAHGVSDRGDAQVVDVPGVPAQPATPQAPLSGGAFGSETPVASQEPIVTAPEDEANSKPSFGAQAEAQPFASFGAPAGAQPFASETEPAPFAPAPEADVNASAAPAGEAASVPSFAEELPPFPGAPQSGSPFASPFKDANPFAPSAPPADAQPAAEDATKPAAPGEAEADDEAPRWNF